MLANRRTISTRTIVLLFAIFTLLSGVSARDIESGDAELKLELIYEGLGVPWGMAFLSPQQLLISERHGRLQLLDLQRQSVKALTGLPAIASGGQGGLLDVAIGPNYAREGWIYITYSKAVGAAITTVLARARIERQRLVDWQDLLITDAVINSGRHFGSRIAFDDRGHVFFGVGDRSKRDLAQDTSNHAGTILRLNLDGSVPTDNPFLDDKNAKDEIWSYGHRNPQGLLFDSVSQQLWSIEHGPRGGDEINLIRKGQNYGWPIVSHGKEYWAPLAIGEGRSKPGIEAPHLVYIPSIAPSSLLLYRGKAFPKWYGNLFAGALKLQHISRVSVSDAGRLSVEERLLENRHERIRNLVEGPQGSIYIATDSGRILRMRPR